MNPILESLKSGPKLYKELRWLMPQPTLDITLGRLLRSRAIVLVPDPLTETARFGLPPVPPTDKPPPLKTLHLKKPEKKPLGRRPVDGPTKVCARCLQTRRINQFGRSQAGGNRKNVCYKCVYQRKKDKENEVRRLLQGSGQ